ncbi:unnamed protein product [Rotaria magnacalcarata]|uniref:Uncharacterized protein n=1 Tax=Rotaria magnacalcarata TaxID=392030 RepID=A0A816ZSY6_9BILA|nr:unnamed protein product [Rotaria magnacalcarata]
MPRPSQWNASDYQSCSGYYKNLNDSHIFTQEDNLHLDRLSSPKYFLDNGSKVIYLRKQYHMPDLNGSSTTLYFVDINIPLSPKTVQLT